MDRKLCNRKLTPVVTQITNIIQSDIGRPISHIAFKTNINDFHKDILNVVETLQPIDREIATKDGRDWQTRLRPYRTEYNSVEGF